MSPTTASGREIVFSAPDLRTALAGLCRLAEAELPGAVAGFTLADAGGERVSGGVYPGLPPSFESGLVGVRMGEPYIGACVRAMGTGVSVVSDDILGDMRFDPAWRDLCLRAGLKALRSLPMRDDHDRVVGTFVIGYRAPGPNRWDDTLMTELAALGGQAVSLYRTLKKEVANVAD